MWPVRGSASALPSEKHPLLNQDSAELLLIFYKAGGLFVPSGGSPSLETCLCIYHDAFVSWRARTVIIILRVKGEVSQLLALLKPGQPCRN